MFWLRGLIALAATFAATSALADTEGEFDTVQRRVQHAVDSADFDGLEAIAAGYRAQNARTSAGTAYLSIFYRNISYIIYHMDTPGGQAGGRGERFLNSWLQARPRGVVANIVEAKFLRDRAGRLRGGGYVDTVPDAAWPEIGKNVELARKRLLASRSFAATDPQWYTTMIDVALLDRQSPGWVEPIFREGASRFPTYMPMYRSMAQYWLPQWYGSYERLDSMARQAASAPAPEADGSYARIYRMLNESCGCSKPLREKTAIDWATMKRSMRAVVVRYPDRWNFSSFAQISCEAGDLVEAQFFIARMGKPTDPYFAVGPDGRVSCPINTGNPQT